MPAMPKTYDKLRDKGFAVLAINELEADAKVREHIKQYGHTFPVLMDRDSKVANQAGGVGLPVTVFIDQERRLQDGVNAGHAPGLCSWLGTAAAAVEGTVANIAPVRYSTVLERAITASVTSGTATASSLLPVRLDGHGMPE